MRAPRTVLRSLLYLTALGLLTGLILVACATPYIQESTGMFTTARLEQDQAVMTDGFILPLSAWGPETPEIDHGPEAPEIDPEIDHGPEAPEAGDRPEGRQPRAIILALHGFNDYRKAFEAMANGFALDGVRTYAYDQRGFGGTQGRGLWPGVAPLVSDARTMLHLLRTRYPDTPLYLLGKSMGGAVAIKAMTEGPKPAVDGTILVAPAVWARQTMPWYQRLALNIGARLAPGRTLTGSGLKIQPSDNLEMLRALANDPMMIRETRIDAVHGLGNLMDTALAAVPRLTGKTLILYGLNDQIIPHRPTCRMLETLPPVPPAQWRFVLYPEGYHMLTRDLQRARVHDDISAWIRATDAELPSGLETDRQKAMATLCK